MECEINIKKKLILILNEYEVNWLKEIMQNSFDGKSPEEENIKDREMRRKFFEACIECKYFY